MQNHQTVDQDNVIEITKKIFGDPTKLVNQTEIAAKGFGSRTTQWRLRKTDPNYPSPIIETPDTTKWLPEAIVSYHLRKRMT